MTFSENSKTKTENMLRMMAVVMRQKNKTLQVDITPEFLEELADEIANLKAQIEEQK